MSGLIDAATAIMSGAERRLETIAQNVANLSTPGYQRTRSFSVLLDGRGGNIGVPQVRYIIDQRSGSLVETGNPFDIAVEGQGSLLFRDGDRYIFARSGSLRRDDEGRLVDGRGFVLQQAGGGDLIIDSPAAQIVRDGTVLIDNEPSTRVGIFVDASREGDISARSIGSPDRLEEVDEPQIRSGYLEQSNVVLDEEMIDVIQVSRAAEGGARLVQIYDELLERVMSNIEKTGR
jgi:flagellar basal-body rod protein FlgF